MPVLHNFVNPLADEPGFLGTKPSDWNDGHAVSIENADVAVNAGIEESKLSLNFPTHAPVALNVTGTNGLALFGQQLGIALAGANSTGTLSAQDWNTFNSKQGALSFPLSSSLGGTGINNGANTLIVPTSGTAALLAVENQFTAKQFITHDAAGKDELIHLWGGTTDPLSGPSIGFYQHYGGGSYPNFKVGEIVSTWAYPDKADLVFYVNDGTDLTSGTNMLAGLRLLGVGTGRIDAHILNGTLYADSSVASQIKIIAKGSASQSVNLQEWQISDGSPKAWVANNGLIYSTPVDNGGVIGIGTAVNHTSDDTGYGMRFDISIPNNGLTSGTSISNGFYGVATLLATTANSFNNSINAGFVRVDVTANSLYTAKVNSLVGLAIDAPIITGAGTIVITTAYGLSIANMGNSKTTTAYGVNIASQSGAGTNYAIYTNTGTVSLGDILFLRTVKSGATQAGAGAAANEIWKTSGHATLPDNVLMIGV